MAKKKKDIDTSITWNDIRNRVIWLGIALLVLFFLITIQAQFVPETPPAAPAESFVEKLSKLQDVNSDIVFRDADIIFQETSGELSQRIAAITGSRVTHCGLIFIEDEKIYVLDAWEKVRVIPVESWIQSGVGKRFALLRDEKLSSEQRENILAEGKKFSGRPYDFKFEFDDEELYCSELVYKAYKNGAGVIAGKLVKLQELDYKNHEDFIRSITPGGKLNLERELITPVEIYNNKNFIKIYDDFSLVTK
jgi:hypothetical protein